MYNKIGIILFVCCFFLFGECLADVIQLKSGKTLEGQIVEEKEKYIKLKINNSTMKIWNKMIDQDATQTLQKMQNRRKAAERQDQSRPGEQRYFQMLGFYDAEQLKIYTVYAPHTHRLKLRAYASGLDWLPGEKNIVYFFDIRNVPIQTGEELSDESYRKNLVARYIRTDRDNEKLEILIEKRGR